MKILVRNKPGFTMIELVISLSIIVLITALFIANYRSSNRQTDLSMLAQKMVADLHLAQNNALGLVKYGTSTPAGGWGVYFNADADPSLYHVFADTQAPGESGNMLYSASSEGIVALGARTSSLSAGTYYTLANADGSSIEEASVTFLPPDPRTNIYANSATSTYLEITIHDSVNASAKTVRVNFLGLVEVLD